MPLQVSEVLAPNHASAPACKRSTRPAASGVGSAFEENDLLGRDGDVQGLPAAGDQRVEAGRLPGGDGEQPVVVRGEKRREAGEADLAGLVETQVLREPAE